MVTFFPFSSFSFSRFYSPPPPSSNLWFIERLGLWPTPLPPNFIFCSFCPKVQLWRRLYREGSYSYPIVSMNPSFWLYFWYILTTYWLKFGYILPTCWLHSVPFWLHSGCILDTFVYILVTFWLPFGYTLDTFWLHFGNIL